MRTLLYVIAALAATAAVSGCASGKSCLADVPSCLEISPPDIHLTGEKTVIERQIVGDYRELERDAWIVSSVKTDVARSRGPAVVMGGDEALLRAVKIREFNEAKLRAYKDEGAVGEANTGLAVYMPQKRYESEAKEIAALLRLIEDENAARRTIFERSVARAATGEPSRRDIDAFGAAFAEEQAAMARKNDWVQDKTGKWVRKK
ncbi:MAG TPA: DUF1318 domain-containing protein [Spirochaetota bacterium]|nr:MAG: hypothetical protein BWY96_02447 [Spirochaetes bacterium ADurb.BinA120]HPI13576.1 DUF1318 domain-containing protein [Spirochaetota bacterium]HPO44167.1 DUF1318 domain-containing protein [Spirochaetota bacterium]